jgi:hypothetical protein
LLELHARLLEAISIKSSNQSPSFLTALNPRINFLSNMVSLSPKCLQYSRALIASFSSQPKYEKVSHTINPYTHFPAIGKSLHIFWAYAADWDFYCADENVVRTLGKALEN